jgi:hypothetical protein
MESDATFTRPASIVVLDAISAEDVRTAIVHPNRDAEMVFAYGKAQQITSCSI